MSFESWLKATRYPQRRKIQLQQLHDRIDELGINTDSRDVCRVKCFIKNESYPKFKFPRAIYSRSDMFKIMIGRFFKVLEESIYHLKNPNGVPYFIKPIPHCDRTNFIIEHFNYGPGFTCEGVYRRYFTADYKAMEGSFRPELMRKVEMVMYDHVLQFLPCVGEFRRLMEVLFGVNVCVFRNFVLKIVGRRMSGEMNTSLGNGFSNLMIILYNLREIGVFDAVVVVEGDDSLVSYVGRLMVPCMWSRFGFTVFMMYHISPNLASFCGQLFDESSGVVIADPMKIVLNFSWFNKKYREVGRNIRYGLIRGKALSLLYLYPGCPIVQSFALAYIRLTKDYKVYIDSTLDAYKKRILFDAIKFAKLPVRDVEPTARDFMQLVYGIAPTSQCKIEEYFDGLTTICPIRPPLYEFVSQDCLYYDFNYVRDVYGKYIVSWSEQITL